MKHMYVSISMISMINISINMISIRMISININIDLVPPSRRSSTGRRASAGRR